MSSDQPIRILVSDDNRDTCRYIAQQLLMESDLSVKVDAAYDRDETLDRIKYAKKPYDIVIADLWMPDRAGVGDKQGGLKALQEAKKGPKPADVIIITGHSSADTSLRASLTGARDYIIKPIDYERLVRVVRAICAERRMDADEAPMRDHSSELTTMVGSSPAMIELTTAVGRVAPTDSTVLIVGESGSGKELVAEAIHKCSPRADKPFIAINCSAIPDELVEAELFGIDRRVATDVDAREGKFMEAEGGTLFLDEIGDMSLEAQPKLLRALEKGEIQRVGGPLTRCDVRIVAATNQPLEEAARNGKLRRDLYYRIRAVTIRVPPLRERRDDIPMLAEFFLMKHCQKLKKHVFGFGKDVLPRLMTRVWGGNIRELRNAVEAAALQCGGVLIRCDDFPPDFWDQEEALEGEAAHRDSSNSYLRMLAQMPLSEASAEFEKYMIRNAMERANGNVTQAAERLQINRSVLHRKIKAHQIKRES